MRAPAPVKSSVQGDQLNREVRMASSPMRLGSGGRARLARAAASHQVNISGRTSCIPRIRSIVRLWVRS